MGRHADPTDGSFRRSLTQALGRGALLTVVVVAVVVAATRIGGQGEDAPPTPTSDTEVADAPEMGEGEAPVEELDPPPDAGEIGAVADRPAVAPEPAEGSTDSPTATPLGPPARTASPNQSPTDASLRIQVLYEPQTAALADQVIARLNELGYEVEFTNLIDRPLEESAVLVNDDSRGEAEALVAAEPRLGEVRTNDRYSDIADMHVLVGRDWASG